MKKYLLPWERYRISGAYPDALFRYSIDERCIAQVSLYDAWTYSVSGRILSKDSKRCWFKTKELAIEACDKFLVENGYTFITLERAEKLGLLL